MEIKIESLIEGARRAQGKIIIIDVFRAFTTAAIALDRGAKKIIVVGNPETALALRQIGAGDLCMGEVDGKRAPGFDFGNSPFELSQANVAGKILIQSTSAGTAGAAAAQGDGDLYVASLVNARATAVAVRQENPALVTLVAMGKGGLERSDEDELCAIYLRNLLLGHQLDKQALCQLILDGSEAAKFDDPQQPHFHPQDRHLALQIDTLNFAIRVSREDDLLVARKWDVGSGD